jgi:SRSO17 transposase
VKGIHGKEHVMERRFAVRFQGVMADAQIHPGTFRGIVERLEEFVEPFAACLKRVEQREHAKHYVAGLCSGLQRKNMEMIAYLHDQDRQPLQKFIGQVAWDHRPLIGELARQVGTELGETDGVLVFDPSGFPKQGRNSVGVARQWCGRLGLCHAEGARPGGFSAVHAPGVVARQNTA